MKSYSIPPAPTISLPIVGSKERFPVRRIYCVGKNYKKHVAEMGGDPKNSAPIFFTKSRETLVESGAQIPYPPQTQNLHFEVELVVALASADEVFGYATGIDMTRRDLQAAAKTAGNPWDMSKNFDHSAPCSAITKAFDAPDIQSAAINLTKNGTLMQASSLHMMIWPLDEILNHLGQSVKLRAGDLIFTGTPEGVGPVVSGDHITGEIKGLAPISVSFSNG